MKIKTKSILHFSLCVFLAQTFLFASETLPPLPDIDETELPPLPEDLTPLPPLDSELPPLLPPLPPEVGEIDISYLKSVVIRDPQTALVLVEDYLETFLRTEDVPLDGVQDFFQLVATAQKAIGENIASEYNFAVMDFLLGRSEQAIKNLRKLVDVLQASSSDSITSKIRHSRCLHLMAIVEHSLGNEQEALLLLERAIGEIPAKPLPITYNANELPPLPPLPGTPEYSEHWGPS